MFLKYHHNTQKVKSQLQRFSGTEYSFTDKRAILNSNQVIFIVLQNYLLSKWKWAIHHENVLHYTLS